jgi:hypothetical protein
LLVPRKSIVGRYDRPDRRNPKARSSIVALRDL